MKFEINPSFKESIQSFPVSYKNITKDLAEYLVTIMEDQRERNRAVALKVVQLQNLFDECWYLNKLIRVHYFLKNRKDTFDKIDFTMTLEIKIVFWWNSDSVKILNCEYSVVRNNKPAQCDNNESHRKSCEDFKRLIYLEERNITFVHHKLSEILEIIDHCGFPSPYLKKYFIGMKDVYLFRSVQYYEKRSSINNFDPRDDLLIKSAYPHYPEIKKYFNKDKSFLMKEAEVVKRDQYLLRSIEFSEPLSMIVRVA